MYATHSEFKSWALYPEVFILKMSNGHDVVVRPGCKSIQKNVFHLLSIGHVVEKLWTISILFCETGFLGSMLTHGEFKVELFIHKCWFWKCLMVLHELLWNGTQTCLRGEPGTALIV